MGTILHQYRLIDVNNQKKAEIVNKYYMEINGTTYDIEKVIDALLSMYTIKINDKLYNVLDLSWNDLVAFDESGASTFKDIYTQLFEIYDLLIEDIVEAGVDANTITVLNHVKELLQV